MGNTFVLHNLYSSEPGVEYSSVNETLHLHLPRCNVCTRPLRAQRIYKQVNKQSCREHVLPSLLFNSGFLHLYHLVVNATQVMYTVHRVLQPPMQERTDV